MGRKKKHVDEAAKKAADANRKKLKRAADKMANQIKAAEKENIQWISEVLLKLVNEIPHKAEVMKLRRQANTKGKAAKRAAITEPVNVLSKRPKYVT